MLLELLNSIPLIRLLRRGSQRFDLRMGLLIGVAGLANAGLLVIINAAANARGETSDGRLLATFALTIGVYLYAQRSILFTTIAEVEKLLSAIEGSAEDVQDVRAGLTSIQDPVMHQNLSAILNARDSGGGPEPPRRREQKA